MATGLRFGDSPDDEPACTGPEATMETKRPRAFAAGASNLTSDASDGAPSTAAASGRRSQTSRASQGARSSGAPEGRPSAPAPRSKPDRRSRSRLESRSALQTPQSRVSTTPPSAASATIAILSLVDFTSFLETVESVARSLVAKPANASIQFNWRRGSIRRPRTFMARASLEQAGLRRALVRRPLAVEHPGIVKLRTRLAGKKLSALC
jgi:hypothetical protein